VQELVILVVILGLLLGSALVVSLLSWHTVFGTGLTLVAVGLAGGVPAGLAYHLELARALGGRGLLERGWFWHPTRLHRHLAGEERRRVMLWFRVGAVGFVVALAGCALAAVGALRSL
jgi:hypothetical protein